MKKSALVFLILTGLLNVALVCAHFGNDFYVRSKMTWSEAREYCREHYTDFTSVINSEEDEFLETVIKASQRAWIGLYKDANDTWRWSGGTKASFYNWLDLGGKSEEQRCAAKTTNGWNKMNCEVDKLNFYCFESSLVLMKENKTWEQAMDHCRDQGGDLVSLPSESALVQTMQTSREAQTDHLWTGLRYLAGTWLWVDQHSDEYHSRDQWEMPQCPAWGHHCGALSLEGERLDSWDCADKLNFVCHLNT